MRYRTAAATMPPTTWATSRARSARRKAPAAASPTVTAGLRWQPEMWPTEYAIVTTVKPNASETPSSPIPTSGNPDAITAEPQPANVSQNVPIASAMYFFVSIEAPYASPRSVAAPVRDANRGCR